jgi:plastocyanin
MNARAVLCAGLIAVIAGPAPARADTSTAGIVDFAFVPPSINVVTGDTIGWRNNSLLMQHTVTGTGFDSGPIVPGGGFFHDFTAPGTYNYMCSIHPFMAGAVDVYDLLLNPPTREVTRGAPTVLTGRAAASVKSLTIEADTGTGFRPIGTGQASGGAFKANVRPPGSGLYRAAAGASASPPVQIQASDRSQVIATVSRRMLRVLVAPPSPGGRVSLQFKLRERFGWWTVARARLDRNSRASFRLHLRKRLPARAVLTQSDGWTPLAISTVVRAGPALRYHRRA